MEGLGLDGRVSTLEGTVSTLAGQGLDGRVSTLEGQNLDSRISVLELVGLGHVRTILVSPDGDGSDALANGQNLADAITFLGAVVPPPGAANPWLIKIEPGIYDMGSSPVQMLDYVDMEGSGVNTTKIKGNPDTNISVCVISGGVVRL